MSIKMTDIFRQLTNGAKFDLKKFDSDASAFNLRKCEEELINSEEYDFEALKSKDKIHVIGEDIPDPIDSFGVMRNVYRLSDTFMGNLEKANFMKPTPVQMQAIPLMMDKRELICCSFTGSGKTLAFLLPVICKVQEAKNDSINIIKKSSKNKPISHIRAVILAPTCELARQINRECNWFAYGSDLSICLINNVYKFEDNNFDILITTPKRLVFLIEKQKVILNNLEYLVIDECDRLFQHIFRQQLAIIYQACSESPNISRALFSATFDRKLEKWFQLNLDNVVTLLIGDKLNVPKCIKQELKYVGDENGKFMALKEIITNGITPPVLIFCQYKHSSNALYVKMKHEKYNVAILHSEVAEAKRSEIINQFRAGKIWFLVCTELMGRGIDFKGVSCLINYDYPPDPITYIHRVGRTGRQGKKGRAITFFTHEEMEHPTKLRYIVTIMKQAGYDVANYLQNFKELAELPAVKRKRKFYDQDGKVKKLRKDDMKSKKSIKRKKGSKTSDNRDGQNAEKSADINGKKTNERPVQKKMSNIDWAKKKQRKIIRKKVLLKNRSLKNEENV